MTFLATVLTESDAHELAPLIMPPLAFGVIAAVFFVALAIVTWSYRDVANRHADKSSHDDSHAGH